MTVGVLQLDLFISDALSLKDKRAVVRSIIERAQARFNASIAEVDHQDAHQLATLGVACVSGSAVQANRVLNKIRDFVERDPRAVVTRCEVELV